MNANKHQREEGSGGTGGLDDLIDSVIMMVDSGLDRGAIVDFYTREGEPGGAMALCWSMLDKNMQRYLSHPIVKRVIRRFEYGKHANAITGDTAKVLAETLDALSALAALFLIRAIKENRSEVEGWKDVLVERAFGEEGVIDDYVGVLPLLRTYPRAILEADRVAKEAFGEEGRRFLENGDAKDWALTYPKVLLALNIQPRYLFEALELMPTYSWSRIAWLIGSVGGGNITGTLTYATSEDVPLGLWPRLIMSEDVRATTGFREWVFNHMPEFSNAEMAHIAHHGDEEVRRWVLRKLGRKNAEPQNPLKRGDR